jgi:HEAT repeat protein
MNISRADPTFLLQCLDDPDDQVRSGALMVFHDLERRVPQAIPKLQALAEKDPDPDVRSRAADILKLELQ